MYDKPAPQEERLPVPPSTEGLDTLSSAISTDMRGAASATLLAVRRRSAKFMRLSDQ